MPACASADFLPPRRPARVLPLALAVFLAASASLAAAAGFKVSSIQSRTAGQTLLLSGNLDLSLSAKVEEAVGKGIPIELALDVRLFRRRPVLWDERIDSWTVRRELRYHALSGQYLIGGPGPEPAEQESMNSLNEALLELGSVDDLTLPLEAPLSADAQYRVDVRVSLDIEALPALLRPVAYTSRAWDLNSGWTTWKVQR